MLKTCHRPTVLQASCLDHPQAPKQFGLQNLDHVLNILDRFALLQLRLGLGDDVTQLLLGGPVRRHLTKAHTQQD